MVKPTREQLGKNDNKAAIENANDCSAEQQAQEVEKKKDLADRVDKRNDLKRP